MASTLHNTLYTKATIADMLSISKATVAKWEKNKILIPESIAANGDKKYSASQLMKFEKFQNMYNSQFEKELAVNPLKEYTSLELFAGAGGAALGFEKEGFKHVLLNEINKDACNTLKKNKPNWNVIEEDVAKIDFSMLQGAIDFLAGGFPCQAFSYAGKKLGFQDIRGTLFFEFARAIKEIQPKVFLGENVRGLLNHDKGRTLEIIKETIKELGYTLVEPQVLKAIFYKVPQKRERLFLIGIRNDLTSKVTFSWPSPYYKIMTVKDALKAGTLYNTDVPLSLGQEYPKRKKEILKLVPQGGYWKDLPTEIQKEYMQTAYFLTGGKTGIARRLSWDEPSLTLTCSPAQKQTERCHPEETRPLTVREYARLQTFPDTWEFTGSTCNQYKQIGNAVPVNLSHAVGCRIIDLLNTLEK